MAGQLYRFDIGETMLCYHRQLLYEVKCLKRRFNPTDKEVSYYIHYKGWKSTYDEWVVDSVLIEANNINMLKMARLKLLNTSKTSKPKKRVKRKSGQLSLSKQLTRNKCASRKKADPDHSETRFSGRLKLKRAGTAVLSTEIHNKFTESKLNVKKEYENIKPCGYDIYKSDEESEVTLCNANNESVIAMNDNEQFGEVTGTDRSKNNKNIKTYKRKEQENKKTGQLPRSKQQLTWNNCTSRRNASPKETEHVKTEHEKQEIEVAASTSTEFKREIKEEYEVIDPSYYQLKYFPNLNKRTVVAMVAGTDEETVVASAAHTNEDPLVTMPDPNVETVVPMYATNEETDEVTMPETDEVTMPETDEVTTNEVTMPDSNVEFLATMHDTNKEIIVTMPNPDVETVVPMYANNEETMVVFDTNEEAVVPINDQTDEGTRTDWENKMKTVFSKKNQNNKTNKPKKQVGSKSAQLSSSEKLPNKRSSRKKKAGPKQTTSYLTRTDRRRQEKNEIINVHGDENEISTLANKEKSKTKPKTVQTNEVTGTGPNSQMVFVDLTSDDDADKPMPVPTEKQKPIVFNLYFNGRGGNSQTTINLNNRYNSISNPNREQS